MNEKSAYYIDKIREQENEIYELKKDHLAEIEKLKADFKNIEEESWQAYMSM